MYKAQAKNLSKFVLVSWSLRPHSGCATGAERVKRFVNVY